VVLGIKSVHVIGTESVAYEDRSDGRVEDSCLGKCSDEAESFVVEVVKALRMRKVSKSVFQEPTIVVASNHGRLRFPEKRATSGEIASTIGDVSDCRDVINSEPREGVDRGSEPYILRVNVADDPQPLHPQFLVHPIHDISSARHPAHRRPERDCDSHTAGRT